MYLFIYFDEMINVKNIDPDRQKPRHKYSYLPHWICDDHEL